MTQLLLEASLTSRWYLKLTDGALVIVEAIADSSTYTLKSAERQT